MRGAGVALSLAIFLALAAASCSMAAGEQREVAEIPVYPQAELLSEQRDESQDVTAEYLVHAGIAEVAEFYRTRPAESGWEMSSTTSGTRFSYYYVSRGGSPAPETGIVSATEGYTLDVSLREDGQATIISIQRTFHSPAPGP